MKTWDVLSWPERPKETKPLALCCPECGTEAVLPIGPTPGAMVIAAIGLSLIFDPPGYVPAANAMPDEIRCRECRRVFSCHEAEHVR